MVSATEPAPPLVAHLVYFAGGRLTLKQARRGTLLIGGGWPARLDDRTGRLAADFARARREPPPRHRGRARGRRRPGSCARGRACAPGSRTSGPRSASSLPGFVVALFPYLGFTCGPLLGRLGATLALGDDPGFDLSPFAPSRLL